MIFDHIRQSYVADLWGEEDVEVWRTALRSYPRVIAAQKVPPLVELDGWYRDELPAAILSRSRPHITHGELV